MKIANVYKEVYKGLPLHIKTSIENYTKSNKIITNVEISDAKVKLLDSTQPVGLARFKGNKRTLLFRRIILEAPRTVRQTIIQHEIIHCYVQPYFGYIIGHSPISDEDRMIIRTAAEAIISSRQRDADVIPEGAALEEAVVKSLNILWGGDEIAAEQWLQTL